MARPNRAGPRRSRRRSLSLHQRDATIPLVEGGPWLQRGPRGEGEGPITRPVARSDDGSFVGRGA